MSAEQNKSNYGEPLSEREREILENLAEEAAEVIQGCMKLLRFGKEATNPVTGASNSYEFGLEVGGLWAMVDLAAKDQLLLEADVSSGRDTKLEKLASYSRHLP